MNKIYLIPMITVEHGKSSDIVKIAERFGGNSDLCVSIAVGDIENDLYETEKYSESGKAELCFYYDCEMTADDTAKRLLESALFCRDRFASRLKTAFCRGLNISPQMLNKCGIFTCVADSESLPYGAFYLKGSAGSEVLVFNLGNKSFNAVADAKVGYPVAYVVSADESADSVLQKHHMQCGENSEVRLSAWQEYFYDLCDSLVDLPVYEAISDGELLRFSENKKIGDDIVVSCSNIKIDEVKSCADGSGDIVIRLHETAGTDGTHCALLYEKADAGFWFDIAANEIKVFRINRDNSKVRDIGFDEGIIPHNS